MTDRSVILFIFKDLFSFSRENSECEVKLFFKESVLVKALGTARCRTTAEILIVKAEYSFLKRLEFIVMQGLTEHIGCEVLSVDTERLEVFRCAVKTYTVSVSCFSPLCPEVR